MYCDAVLHIDDDEVTLEYPLNSVGKDEELTLEFTSGDVVETLHFKLTYYKDNSPEARKTNHWSNKVQISGVLTDFYSCCGILIGANWAWDKKVIDVAVELALAMGYTSILYAIAEGQEKLCELLVAEGFVPNPASEFRNIRSDNKVTIYSKVLEE